MPSAHHPFQRVRLRHRLLLLMLGAVVGTAALIGTLFIFLTAHLGQEQARARLNAGLAQVDNRLAELDAELVRAAETLARRRDVTATVNLIARYQDQARYRPLVFDGEKAMLAGRLATFLKAAGLDLARVTTDDGTLIAYAWRQGGDIRGGFLSYDDGIPRPRALTGNGQPVDHALPPVIHQAATATGPRPRVVAGRLLLLAPETVRLAEGEPALGRVLLGRHLGAAFADAMARRTGLAFAFGAPQAGVPMTGSDLPAENPQALALPDNRPAWTVTAEWYLGTENLRLDDGQPLVLRFGLPRAEGQADVINLRRAALIGIGLVALLVLPLAAWLLRQWITRPIESLTGAIETVRTGHYDQLPRLPRDPDFGRLVLAFRDMAGELEAREEELAETHRDLEKLVADRTRQLERSESGLRQILETVVDGIITADSDGQIRSFNPAAERMFGYAAEEVIGQPLSLLMPSPEAGEHQAHVNAFLAGQSDSDAVGRGREVRGRHRDGRIFHLEVALSHARVGGEILFTGIVRDVTARHEAEAALRRAKEDAERASRAKSDFLSAMSHELRTPLNAILGFAQLLEAGRTDPLTERQRSQVQYILKAGDHLLDLINEVLDLARIETGRLSVSIEEVSLGAALGESLAVIAPIADRRKITVTAPDADGLPAVRADFIRLKQVLLNLLSNAVKYNNEGGSVTVTVTDDGDDQPVGIAVADDGPGIPADRRDELFQPFNRLGAETSEVEGTGIGLALSKALIELMGGTIDVESGPGQGAVFRIRVPRGTMPTASAPPTAPDPEPASTGARLVLYVEDNPANIRLIREVIDEWGDMAVITAHTGELGLEMAIDHRPDVILMDINLPGMNGLATLAALKRDPRTRAIPVIALSADAMPKAVARGREAGFQTYLTKPVKIPELRQALARALESAPPS